MPLCVLFFLQPTICKKFRFSKVLDKELFVVWFDFQLFMRILLRSNFCFQLRTLKLTLFKYSKKWQIAEKPNYLKCTFLAVEKHESWYVLLKSLSGPMTRIKCHAGLFLWKWFHNNKKNEFEHIYSTHCENSTCEYTLYKWRNIENYRFISIKLENFVAVRHRVL